MRIVHFLLDDDPAIRFGFLRDDSVIDATDLLEPLDPTRTCGGLNERFNLDGPILRALEGHAEDASSYPVDSVQLLAPVPRPGKVFCIGLNYHDHAKESGMEPPELPLVFSKFGGCVIGPNEPVVLPPGATEVDYEAELAIVIGRHAQDVAEADALDFVLGYCAANDISARDFQFADGQWQRGKSCDTFCPLGPWIVTRDELPDPHTLAIHLRLNEQEMQASNTEQLIFKVPRLVEFLSGFIALEPGDVILTGTPPGVGFAQDPPIYLKAGDTMDVEIEGLGVLSNPVVDG
ncbi:MAG: fumarylacetoacetate hydrolase family protein [Phycisphaerales bacterium]|nr:fumarylacetoacetate hydrolase family protein [Phycisphaerales bacterium]